MSLKVSKTITLYQSFYYLDNDVDDLREKLNIMTNKFITVRKDKDQLQKENKELQNEILILQSNIRQMIPGFGSNTSGSFPMLNELQNKLSEFFKCDCQDIFFDLLSPELNIDGIVFFFKNCILKIQELVFNYFEPMESLLKKTIGIDSLWTPIDNVLRKSVQSNWRKIFSQMCLDASIQAIVNFIQNNLKLQDEDPRANKIIFDFLKKSCEIYFCCHVSDPQVFIDINSIGQKILFNPIKHDSVDGFIKQKHECVVVLPACYKINASSSENMLFKAQVLPLDYEFP